ncbi:hypothetical protein AOT96_32920 (plasmid) [Rhodococcus sp. 008]|nr:hypothetical protein AOT96_32920 [Rhodococcus sp. 008]
MRFCLGRGVYLKAGISSNRGYSRNTIAGTRSAMTASAPLRSICSTTVLPARGTVEFGSSAAGAVPAEPTLQWHFVRVGPKMMLS